MTCVDADDADVLCCFQSQLGFLVAGANVPLSPEEAPASKAVRGLLRMVQQEADIEAWVKKNVPEEDRTSTAFIKDLVCVLCFNCIVIGEEPEAEGGWDKCGRGVGEFGFWLERIGRLVGLLVDW